MPAGASGCALAWRLAHSKKRPSVLLVEAGGKNDDRALRVEGDKWITRLNPKQTWGYQTVPQKNFNGRCLSYDRGKGLGGSTSVNFCAWNIGPKDDYDEIARLVGDEEWNWTNAQKRLKRLESYHGFDAHFPPSGKKYLDPRPEDHGTDGPLKVGFPVVWEKSLAAMMDICIGEGNQPNPDMNSGNPIGVSVCPQTAYKGIRSTASDMLIDAPSNLHVMTDAEVSHVIFDGKIAVGISTLDGLVHYADKDVILSAGSVNTPKILMLSGVGPVDELIKHDIAVVCDSPHIGRNLRDHNHIWLTWERAEHTTDRRAFYSSKELQAAARTQWEIDQTGPMSELGCTYALGFLKSDAVYRSEEFQALAQHRQAHMQKPTVPTYELVINPGNAEYFMDPEHAPALTALVVILYNTESIGAITLQSSDPAVPALYDPNFFSHPFDKRLALESTRETLHLSQTAAFQKDTVGMLSGPKSDSDDDILAYWREEGGSTWHMTGTCKMGGSVEEGACVDNTFRVIGVQNLRVVDMSVVPITPK